MSFTRRHLPHWIPDASIVFVTWSLANECRWLAEPGCARIVKQALIYGEQVRQSYQLHAWVLMPTHVHVLLTPTRAFPEIMRWLKRTTARGCNVLLGRSGVFWQEESFDHWIRNRPELENTIFYIEHNPVNSGLVTHPEDWPWSSCSRE